MKQAGTLQVSARGEREIVITRDFDAPRNLVYDALTKPELLKRWLGVISGWSLDVCEIDLKVGGSYRYLWRGPDGAQMGMRGVYREIVPNERIVSTEVFDEAWYPGDAVGTTALSEHGGRTTLTTSVVYASKEARDGVLKSPMESGMAEGYKVLDALLASLKAA